MVQLTVVMLLWCCSFIIGYSVSVPTNEELLDNACNLIANKSMRDEFKKTVQDDTVLDGSGNFYENFPRHQYMCIVHSVCIVQCTELCDKPIFIMHLGILNRILDVQVFYSSNNRL